MKLFPLLIGLLFVFPLSGQNPIGFDEMCDNHIKGTVPLINPSALKHIMAVNATILILDAREKKEYDVSHLVGAKFAGFGDFKIKSVSNIDKKTPIYVYCSIGYRSEKIGEKLIKAGFSDVHNLYGGIFNWTNAGFPVVNKVGKATTSVHSHSKKWAKWINNQKSKVILN